MKNDTIHFSLTHKKIVLFLLGVLCSMCIYSQLITGTVLDDQTHDTVSFASVYFNGTFIGTHTDSRGSFSLNLEGRTFMPLTISAIGYYSVTITSYSPSIPLIVYLNPKVYEMPEVVVNAESLVKEREANLKIFRREFLGTSVYALGCEIINEKDITFNYGSDKDTLRAFASRPVQVKNRLLGYDIACYLDKFEFDRNNADYLFRGNIRFEEDLADSKSKIRIEKRRRHAYLGSIMHFFRALWSDDLKSNGFMVNTLNGRTLEYKDLVIENDSIAKYFHCHNRIYISYSGNVTDVHFLSDSAGFYRDGYYAYSDISWKGDMASLRIGDWLPYEYGAESLSPSVEEGKVRPKPEKSPSRIRRNKRSKG